MSEQVAYLDSSAIVKRYVREEGSDVVRGLYLKAYAGEVILSYSTWNIGEVLGAFDKAVRLGRVSSEAYSLVRRRFLLDTRRMARHTRASEVKDLEDVLGPDREAPHIPGRCNPDSLSQVRQRRPVPNGRWKATQSRGGGRLK